MGKTIRQKVRTEKVAQIKDRELEVDTFDRFLRRFEKKLRNIPVIGNYLSYAPLMVELIRNYDSGMYRAISNKSLAVVIVAMVYFVFVTDLLPDIIPIVGYIDDIVVFSICLLIAKKELDKYREWRDQ